jgi:hypothetical protein
LGILPLRGKFFHLGSGYGILDFLLVYDSASRIVLGFDENPEKARIAQNTFTVNRFPVKFQNKIPEILTVFDFVITQNEFEKTRFENLVNLDVWELIFTESEISIFKNKNAGRI